MSATSPDPDPYRILVVCTGNICRSPAGELLLQQRLGGTVAVSSAGTGALVGQPVDPQMQGLLGVDSSTFAARQLTPALLKNSDLLLAMTAEHRSRSVQEFPALVRRAFTFREFARVLQLPEVSALLDPALSPGENLRVVVPQMGARRALVRVPAEENDVPDPYGQSADRFAEAFTLIEECVDRIATALGRG